MSNEKAEDTTNNKQPRPQRRTIAAVLPVYLTVGAVALAAGVALGLHIGNKQAHHIEKEYAHAKTNPSPRQPRAITDTPVTAEMRRFAFRRTILAFGIGTALCSFCGAVGVYAVGQYMNVNSVHGFTQRMNVWTKSMSARFITPFVSSLPSATSAIRQRFADTSVGKWITQYQNEAIEDANAEVENNPDEVTQINAALKAVNAPIAVTEADLMSPPPPPDTHEIER